MSNSLKYILSFLGVALALYLAWYFSNIVAYILISAVLAIIGKPIVDKLLAIRLGKKKRPMPRWAAALTTLLFMWLVIVVIFRIFIPIFFNKTVELSSLDISYVIEAFRKPLLSAQEFIENTFSVSASEFSIAGAITAQIKSIFNIGEINKYLTSTISAIGNLVIAVSSITFITFFFLKENNMFSRTITYMTPVKYQENVERALDSTANLLRRYFTGIVVQSMIMTTLVASGLLIFGFSLQNSLIIGFLVGILNVIPYLGPIIGVFVGLFIGLLGGAGPDVSTLNAALRIAGVILSAQVLDNTIVQPLLYSKQAKAHPLEIFIVILIAGTLAGIWGMVLAVPTYNVLRVFAKEFLNNFRVVQRLTKDI